GPVRAGDGALPVHLRFTAAAVRAWERGCRPPRRRGRRQHRLCVRPAARRAGHARPLPGDAAAVADRRRPATHRGLSAVRRRGLRGGAKGLTHSRNCPAWRRWRHCMTDDLEGGCACAAVRYRLASPPMFVPCCHCRDCQRQTGSAFVINALIETDRIVLLAGDPGPVAVPTDSGRPHLIYRCPNCRTAVWSEYGGLAAPRLVPLRPPPKPAGAAARRAYLCPLEAAVGDAAEYRSGVPSLL